MQFSFLKHPAMGHLYYWGSLCIVMVLGAPVVSYGLLPFTKDLDGLFFLGLFFLHMAGGHYFGYNLILKGKYRKAPYAREYQRSLVITFGLVGLGWIIASVLPQGIGIYGLMFLLLLGVIFSNRRLGQLHKEYYNKQIQETKEG